MQSGASALCPLCGWAGAGEPQLEDILTAERIGPGNGISFTRFGLRSLTERTSYR